MIEKTKTIMLFSLALAFLASDIWLHTHFIEDDK